MLLVFVMSLLLVLPPLTVSVYLWTSVARFYDEIKYYERAIKHLSQKHTTMRLVGSMLAKDTPDVSITPRTYNLNNKTTNNTTTPSANKNRLNNAIVLQNIGNLKDTKSIDHKNDI